ncbi:glycoside hydrolase superfamily [Chaetomium sp. MPI-SDFR-AT-0129]|nr:glycoside hydrolase superfamily [Chaetomium sp. MPI-SDFR-AT-0129]
MHPDTSPNPASHLYRLGGRDVGAELEARANCKVARVGSGDGCWSMAQQKCNPKISVNGFYNYNGGSGKICKSMRPGDYVCCSLGTMPNMDPKQKKTWGFTECKEINQDMIICVSDGDPPMPAAVDNAICGPQKPGTVRPSDKNINLAALNPCPLNACYIVNNDKAPAKFERITYFEAWNDSRPCLNMDVDEVTDPNTIIHFEFGWINEDLTVSVQDAEEQFEKFVKVNTKLKEVISYGGWAFSNEHLTSHIIRRAAQPENRLTFATNAVDSVKKHNLDGVDFDWEYPGADDIGGSDSWTAEDGENYLEFLKLVKQRLPSGATASFAAPASYWYLRHFPIGDVAKVVGYIVYITYDLHGQWDIGNKYAAEDCELGNCLRSHINKTQTENVMSMITKAGVPSYKVFVGISSYGRSFKLAKPECYDGSCLYLGERNRSPAAPGYCTNTSGYISQAEISQLKNIYDTIGGDYYEYYDPKSDSDVLVYDGVEWVPYMDKTTKENRVQWYKDLNFGAVSDWAVDLQVKGKVNSGANGGMESLDLSYKCELKDYDNLDDVIANADKSSEECIAMNAIRALQAMLAEAMSGYDEAASGYDDVFDFYRDFMHDTLSERLRGMMLDDKQPLAGFFNCYYTEGEIGNREDASKYDCKDPPNGYMQSYTFFWEIRDRDGLNKTLSKEGIDIKRLNSGGTGMCYNYNKVHWGFPIGKSEFKMPNPKAVVDEARKTFDTIWDEYDDMYMMLGLDMFEGSPADTVEVLAMPVFLLADAVASMKEVKRIGQDEKLRRTKELVLQIVEGILFLIPFVDAALGSLGRIGVGMARILIAVEGIGNGGPTIYPVVGDPEMLPVAILTMVLGGIGAGGLSGALRYRELSITKGKLTSEQRTSLGPSFRKHNPKIETLSNKICPRR